MLLKRKNKQQTSSKIINFNLYYFFLIFILFQFVFLKNYYTKNKIMMFQYNN
jgi:hypothetical protein